MALFIKQHYDGGRTEAAAEPPQLWHRCPEQGTAPPLSRRAAAPQAAAAAGPAFAPG